MLSRVTCFSVWVCTFGDPQFCRKAGCFQISLFNKSLFEKLLSGGYHQKSTLAPIIYQFCCVVNYTISITIDGVQQLEDVSYGTIWILLADVFAETKAENFTGAFLLIVISHLKWDPSSYFRQSE